MTFLICIFQKLNWDHNYSLQMHCLKEEKVSVTGMEKVAGENLKGSYKSPTN